MAKGLDSRWTKNLEGDAKSDFETIVRNSTRLLTKLKEILEDQEKELHKTEFTIDDFKDPNWSHKQAFRNGKLSVLHQLKNLIPF